MTTHKLKIIPTDLLPAYLEQIPKGLQGAFEALHDAEISWFRLQTGITISSNASKRCI